jgi:hypothetical protein
VGNPKWCSAFPALKSGDLNEESIEGTVQFGSGDAGRCAHGARETERELRRCVCKPRALPGAELLDPFLFC